MDSGGRPRLLTERVSDSVGVSRLAAGLGRPRAGPYGLVVLVWLYDTGLLSGISYLVTGRARFESPYQVVIPVGLVIGVVLARDLRVRYLHAIGELPGDEVTADGLRSVIAGRFPVLVWIVLAASWFVQLALSPGEVAAFMGVHGSVIAAVKYVTVAPLYYLVIADVGVLLLASLVVLPWRVVSRRLTLDFSDVTGFAGLYEVGRLLVIATVIYYAGLTVWTVFLMAPNVVGVGSDVSRADSTVFAALWLLGLALYLVPALLLHRHMAREKQRLIREIDADIRALDPDGEGKGIPYLSPEAGDVPRLQQKYIELQQVRTAREYPVDVNILGELVVATLVPIALQWLLQTGLSV